MSPKKTQRRTAGAPGFDESCDVFALMRAEVGAIAAGGLGADEAVLHDLIDRAEHAYAAGNVRTALWLLWEVVANAHIGTYLAAGKIMRTKAGPRTGDKNKAKTAWMRAFHSVDDFRKWRPDIQADYLWANGLATLTLNRDTLGRYVRQFAQSIKTNNASARGQ